MDGNRPDVAFFVPGSGCGKQLLWLRRVFRAGAEHGGTPAALPVVLRKAGAGKRQLQIFLFSRGGLAALPDQAEAPETAIPVPVYSLAPSTTVQVLEQAEEVVAVSEEITPLYSDEDVAAIAKTVYGEALITHSDMEMAAVAWCILNRVDSAEAFFPDTIVEVVTQDSQFHGYSESNPVDPHIEWLVRDVLDRWSLEKAGAEEVGRILPEEYLYFWGDGRHNHFTTEYHAGTTWDWSAENPYES